MSTANPLQSALVEFAGLVGGQVPWCLIGGLAVGFHARPRGTQDVDVLVSSDAELERLEPLLSGAFRRNRPHCFEHRATGVEVEVVTPELVGMAAAIASGALGSAKPFPLLGADVPVVGPEWLVALKLARASDYDRGDIRAILAAHPGMDLSALPLPPKQRAVLDSLLGG